MAHHIPAGVHFIPAHPVAGTENSGPDAGFAELFVNRWCILTPPPGTDQAAVDRLALFWRLLGANVESMSAGASRPRARHHQPSAASDRLYDRRHRRRAGPGHPLRGAAVLGRRLPRLHAHRRLRSDHVARRVPRQQGRGAGDARSLQRGSGDAHPRDPPRRRRYACSSSSAARGRSAAASWKSDRIPRRPTSAGRIPICRRVRCRDHTRRTTDTQVDSAAPRQRPAGAFGKSAPAPSSTGSAAAFRTGVAARRPETAQGRLRHPPAALGMRRPLGPRARCAGRAPIPARERRSGARSRPAPGSTDRAH